MDLPQLKYEKFYESVQIIERFFRKLDPTYDHSKIIENIIRVILWNPKTAHRQKMEEKINEQ